MKPSTPILWIGLSTTILGCLPVPFAERVVPEIDGRLTSPNGAAVAGWNVKRIADFTDDDVRQGRACERDGDTASTDAAGRFHFHSSWRLLPVIPLYGDPIWRVLVCVQDGDNGVSAWQGGQIGRTPSRIALSCQVEGEPGSAAVQCQTEPAAQ